MPLLSAPILSTGLIASAAARGLPGGPIQRLGSTYNVLHEFFATACRAVEADVAAAFQTGVWVQGTPGADVPVATGVGTVIFTPGNTVAASNIARPGIIGSASAVAASVGWAGARGVDLPASIGEGVLQAQTQANTTLTLTGDTAVYATLLPKYIFPGSFTAAVLASKIQSAWTANPKTASDNPSLQANFARVIATLIVSTITAYGLVGQSTSASPTPPPPSGTPLLITAVYA